MLKLWSLLGKKEAGARRRSGRVCAALAAAAIWLGCTGAAQAVGFTVTVDRTIISLGESVQLSLNFEGASPATTPPTPTVPNLVFSEPPGVSSMFSSINGVTTTTIAYTYTVTPTQAGEFVIPAMTIQVGGQALTSQPVKLTVQKATAQPAAPKTAFLKLIVPKTQVYVGEILPVDLQVFFQMANASEMPHLKEEGFTLGKLIQNRQTDTVVNNMQYHMVPLKTYVVAVRTGKIDLGPATMPMSIPRPDSRRTIFGELVDWQNVTLQSDPQTLNVLPLPTENKPANFNGAVGSYTLSLAASPTNIAVGDPLTVTVQISGRGALDAISLPQQTGWQDFKLYPPTSEVQLTDQLGVTGTKTFKLTAVPQTMDIKELPAFNFSFFDPELKTYRTLTQPAVPLIVRPSAASLPPPLAANTSPTDAGVATARELAPIKQRLGTVAVIGPFLVRQPWFVAAQGIPILAFVSLFVSRKQKERLANNPRLRRQRQVDQMVRQSLQELRKAARASDAEKFFGLLFRLLQEQLGERLDLPASAITESVLDERLRPAKLADATFARLQELFQACNEARYGRERTHAELTALIGKTELALKELKELPA